MVVLVYTVDDIKIDICMWVYGFYLTIILIVFTGHMDWKREVFETSNLELTDDVKYFESMQDNFYFMISMITGFYFIPLLYFNKAGGDTENILSFVYYWIGRFFQFWYSVLFIWECCFFFVICNLFFLLILFLYFIFFYPFMMFIFCLLKFFYFFVEIFNKSLSFNLILKIKFVFLILILLFSMVIFFCNNFLSICTDKMFISLFHYFFSFLMDFFPVYRLIE